MLETVTIGGATCGLDYARYYAEKYLTDHLNADDPEAKVWSYPAYDSYPGSSNGEVGDADLPAIALLNAGRNPVKAYYGLQHLLPVRLPMPGTRPASYHSALQNVFGYVQTDLEWCLCDSTEVLIISEVD